MLASLLLLLSSAQAFEIATNGTADQGWDSRAMPIDYFTNSAGAPFNISDAHFDEVITAAFDEWEAVGGSLAAFTPQPDPVDIRYTEDDGLNVIYWASEWEWDEEILALTSTWSTLDGEIIGFDIRVNADTIDWDMGGMDFQNAMTHEVGHVLGLDHSTREDATMYGATEPGELIKRDLHWDDEDGARFLYPDLGQPDPFQMLGCSSLGSTAPMLLPLLMTAGTIRRRKRTS